MLNIYKFSILIGILLVVLFFVTGCGGGPSCPVDISGKPVEKKNETWFQYSQSVSIKIFGMVAEKNFRIGFPNPKSEPDEEEWEESFFENISTFTPAPTGYARTCCPCPPTATMIPTVPPLVETPRPPFHLSCLTEEKVEMAKKVGIEELKGIYSQKIFINGWIPIRLRNHLVNNGFIITDENDCDFILCGNDIKDKITKDDFRNNKTIQIVTKNGRGVVSGTMLCKEYDDLFSDWDRSLYTPIKIIGMYYKK